VSDLWTPLTPPTHAGSTARAKPTPDPVRVRRNRGNRKRGGTWERDAAREIGGRRMGQLLLPWDVEVEGYARIQTKKLARWPSLAAVVTWLDAMPIGPTLRMVAIADAPGAGHRSRKLVVLDWDEYVRWHGR
jgi:hypothetical protein